MYQTLNLPVIEFFSKAHRYKVNGEWYPSVTGIIGCLDKPALIYWASKVTVEYIAANMDVLKSPLTSNELSKEILKKARSKAQDIKDEAADIGTITHRELSKFAKGQITIDEVDVRVKDLIEKFDAWTKEVGYRFHLSEIPLASLKYKYAGTADLICEINGKMAVADLKTGKACWHEMGLQLAAYRMAYEEMYQKKLEKQYIIRIGYEAKDFEAREYPNYEYDANTFIHLRKVHDWVKSQGKGYIQ